MLSVLLLSPSAEGGGLNSGAVRSDSSAVLKPGKRHGAEAQEGLEDRGGLGLVQEPGGHYEARDPSKQAPVRYVLEDPARPTAGHPRVDLENRAEDFLTNRDCWPSADPGGPWDLGGLVDQFSE
jgi:hypothetical protein